MDILKGVRVIDVTMWAFVPAAGGVLAHWGADVIKVEPPAAPDPIRSLDGTSRTGEDSWLFRHYSRGKRDIAIDLRTVEGRRILYRLVEGADVFLTSFLPETRRKLGFDVDDIRAVNPNIIYARGSGHGPKGPDAERGAYDGATYWGRGSLAQAAMNATAVDWPPQGIVGHGDGMSGLTLAGGICAALVKKARTGAGSVVDGSLLGTAIWYNGPSIISSVLGNDFMAAGALVPHEARHPSNNTYRTSDNRFLILCMLGDFDDEWTDLCEHLGHPELASDPRFADSASRSENIADGVAVFDGIFASRTFEEWKAALAGTKGVWSPVQTPLETVTDPQSVANGFIGTIEYSDGELRLPAPPIMFDEEAGAPSKAPMLGEHTDELLRELGLSEGEIRERRASGVVA